MIGCLLKKLFTFPPAIEYNSLHCVTLNTM